jgi:hypothetical protein
MKNGYAYFNLPLSQGTVWSIIDPLTENEIETIRTDTNIVNDSLIARLNTLRKQLGK